MKHRLDIETWERKEHYLFFKKFEEPFYGVSIHVDCTAAYLQAKRLKVSFFLFYIYQALVAAQLIKYFRLRIEADAVVQYDLIHAGTTIARSNGTFGYGNLEYNADFTLFITHANHQIARVQQRNDLQRSDRNDLIRFSALPWIDFTALSHARMYTANDNCPRISFGKMTEHAGKRSMPMSIHVHHALVDARHLGDYIDCFQELLSRSMLPME